MTTRAAIADLIAPPVRGLQPYVPGKPISELEREYGVHDIVKLASNENPLGPGPLARAAMARALADIGLYPDGNGYELKQRLARHHAVPIETITLGNGSNDVLVLLAEAFLTSEVEAVYSQYCFAVYPIAVQAVGATARIPPALPANHAMPLGHDLEAMLRLVNARTRLVFVANPNNPTGTWISGDELRAFLAALPRTTVAVVDEAYFEYSRDAGLPDCAEWLAELPNLVVTRTFSKAHGLAGLRVGYALSSREIADALNRVRQPFNVNSVALAAATAALDDTAHVRETVELNRAGLAQLRSGLETLGIATLPSAANCVLADFGRSVAPIHEGLLRRSVIARPVGNYGLPNHLRITTGTREQNERFLRAVADVLSRSA
jgi:histidinol-phosphate aminotransferase